MIRLFVCSILISAGRVLIELGISISGGHGHLEIENECYPSHSEDLIIFIIIFVVPTFTAGALSFIGELL